MPESMTKFENDVLNKLLTGNHENLRVLRKQYSEASFKRKLTGVGFFLDFDVPNGCDRVSPEKCELGDVVAKVKGLEHGSGFVLFVENGLLKTLEAYSFEEPWPASISEYSLSYTGENRKLPF